MSSTSDQINKRVETESFKVYEQAAIYKQIKIDGGKYSKVKIIRRSNGSFDVACYVPLEKKDD